MTNAKSTKRAFLTSFAAIILCFAMLTGTTFAWFTDSVTSENNVIKSGNLDITLEYYNGTSWVDVKDASDILAGDLWEPGYVDVAYLRIKNAGSLAFKYNLGVNIVSETAGTNVNGEELVLSDYIYFDVIEGVDGKTQAYKTREDALKVTTEQNLISDGYHLLDELLAGSDFTYLAMVVYMPDSVGNDANYKTSDDPSDPDKYRPEINLGINVVAIQYNHENDSFDNTYDEGLDPETTYLATGKAFNSTTDKSGRYALSADIRTSEGGADARYGWGYEYIVRKGADFTLDLNGKTITHDTVNENANNTALTYLLVANHAGTKLTVNGEGTLHSHNSEGYTCVVQGKDGTLITLNGGEYIADNGIAVWAGAGAHIVINDGTYINGNAATDHELIYSSGGVIDIYGGFFHNTDGNYTLNVEDRNRGTGFINVYGGTYVNFDPSTGGQDPNNIKVAEGYKVVSETQTNGDVWYTVVPE